MKTSKLRKKSLIAAVCILLALAALISAAIVFLLPLHRLNRALELLEAGDKDGAYAGLESIYDCGAISSIKQKKGMELCDRGEYCAAYLLLCKLPGQDCVNKSEEIKKALLQNAAVGDTVFFGSYEQNGKEKGGTEAIAWRVLKKEENQLFLISQFALDCMQYNDEMAETTWETCSLRTWLNDSWYNSVFSDAEKKSILLSDVTADRNPGYNTDPGADTKDRIYLLSTRETQTYFTTDQDRQCFMTSYTLSRGAYTSKPYTPDGEIVEKNGKPACTWITRTPGDKPQQVSLVFYDGSVEYYGHEVNDCSFAIRPVMRISVDS